MKNTTNYVMTCKETVVAVFWAPDDKVAGIIARATMRSQMSAYNKLFKVQLFKEDFRLRRKA